MHALEYRESIIIKHRIFLDIEKDMVVSSLATGSSSIMVVHLKTHRCAWMNTLKTEKVKVNWKLSYLLVSSSTDYKKLSCNPAGLADFQQCTQM